MGDICTARSRFYDPTLDLQYEVLQEDGDYLVVFDDDRSAQNVSALVYRQTEDAVIGPRAMMLARWYIETLPKASVYDVAALDERLPHSHGQDRAHPAQTEELAKEPEATRPMELEDAIGAPRAETREKPPTSVIEDARGPAPAEPRAHSSIYEVDSEPPHETSCSTFQGSRHRQYVEYIEPTEQGPASCEHQPEPPGNGNVTDERSFTVRCDTPDTVSITSLTAPLRNVVVPGTIREKTVTSITLTALGLESLDVSNCPNLRQLVCFDNSLRKLDLKMCPDLELVNCTDNPLKVLDIRGCDHVMPRYDSGVEVLR